MGRERREEEGVRGGTSHFCSMAQVSLKVSSLCQS